MPMVATRKRAHFCHFMSWLQDNSQFTLLLLRSLFVFSFRFGSRSVFGVPGSFAIAVSAFRSGPERRRICGIVKRVGEIAPLFARHATCSAVAHGTRR